MYFGCEQILYDESPSGALRLSITQWVASCSICWSSLWLYRCTVCEIWGFEHLRRREKKNKKEQERRRRRKHLSHCYTDRYYYTACNNDRRITPFVIIDYCSYFVINFVFDVDFLLSPLFCNNICSGVIVYSV